MTLPVSDKEQLKHIFDVFSEADTKQACIEKGYRWDLSGIPPLEKDEDEG